MQVRILKPMHLRLFFSYSCRLQFDLPFDQVCGQAAQPHPFAGGAARHPLGPPKYSRPEERSSTSKPNSLNLTKGYFYTSLVSRTGPLESSLRLQDFVSVTKDHLYTS
jgi:hypothetical protein